MVAVMALGFAVPLQAEEFSNEFQTIDEFSASALDFSKLSSIPLFVVEVDHFNGVVFDEIAGYLVEAFFGCDYDMHTQHYSPFNAFDLQDNTQLFSEIGVLEARQLDSCEALNLLNNDLYALALHRVQMLIDDGLDIPGIIFSVPPSSRTNFEPFVDTSRYGHFFTTYRGFQFRFIDVAIPINTQQVMNNVHSSVNWSQFAWAVAQVGFEVMGGPVSAISSFLGNIQNLTSGFVNAPFNIRIGNVAGNTISNQFVGYITTRTILMEDVNNRWPGRAFIPMAQIDRIAGRTQGWVQFPTQMSGNIVTSWDSRSFSSNHFALHSEGWHHADFRFLDTLIHNYSLVSLPLHVTIIRPTTYWLQVW